MKQTASEVVAMLRASRFNFTSEDELQRGIAMLLEREKVAFEREVVLGPHDRIDFLVSDVGVEVKVDGTFNEVVRQVQRYLEYDRIGTVVLVTTRNKHRDIPVTLRGKTVVVVVLQTGFM